MYQIEEKLERGLYTYKVLDSGIVTYKYIWAYSWDEGALELESQGFELVD